MVGGCRKRNNPVKINPPTKKEISKPQRTEGGLRKNATEKFSFLERKFEKWIKKR